MESGHDEVGERALKVLEEAKAKDQDWRIYLEAMAPAEKTLEEALTKAFQTYREVEAQARKIRNESVASALKKFREDAAPAWVVYLKATAGAQET